MTPLPNIKISILRALRYVLRDSEQKFSASSLKRYKTRQEGLKSNVWVNEGRYYIIREKSKSNTSCCFIGISIEALMQEKVEHVAQKALNNHVFCHCYYDKALDAPATIEIEYLPNRKAFIAYKRFDGKRTYFNWNYILKSI